MSLPGRLISFGVCSPYFCVLFHSFCVLLPISVYLCFCFCVLVAISVSCLLVCGSFSLILFIFVFVFVLYVPISVSCLVSGAAAVGSALPRFNPPAGGLRL